MPARNVLKRYQANSYYHIYNRGVEKRTIYEDEMDYKVFLSYLKEYLEPIQEEEIREEIEKTHQSQKDKLLKKLLMNNFSDDIELLAYCLMPNHFHLLIKQKQARGIEKFMRSLATRYVVYFNKRHDRVGALFQNTYKAVLVNTDDQLVHLSRYIHQNPNKLPSYKGYSFLDYPYSSMGAYLEKWRVKWLKHRFILDRFSKTIKQLGYKEYIMADLTKKDDSLLDKITLD